MSIQLQKLDYTIVYVSDMDRSLVFYRDVLGLPLKFSSPGWSEFNTGTTTIALHATPASKAADQPGRTPAGVAQGRGGVAPQTQTLARDSVIAVDPRIERTRTST